MLERISMLITTVVATALMVGALWAWQQAPHLVFDADRPEIATWAVRTAAIAAAAMAQALLLLFVVGRIYRTRRAGGIDVALRVLTAAVFTVALVSAIALTLADR
jgi:hypothetical protein